MDRSLADSRRWMAQGTEIFLAALARADDAQLDAATDLKGWTGRHVVSHVAANAEALGNLAQWARTGLETPMYASAEQRDADIESGALRPARELRGWAEDSATRLASDLARLAHDDWSRPVRTAQGRVVAASEIPWMRAREVMVHAVDLDRSTTFGDLPADFLACLVRDIVAKRSSAGTGPALHITPTDARSGWDVAGLGPTRRLAGRLSDVAAWLAGRPATLTPTDGLPVPALPAWL